MKFYIDFKTNSIYMYLSLTLTYASMFFPIFGIFYRNAIQYSLKITTQIPGQGLGRPGFFPIQSALSLRFWVANVAREHFGLNLRSKFPLPDRVVDENFYPGVN